MPIPTPKTNYTALKRHVKALDKRYVEPHVSTLKPTPGQQLDLDAYAVLCHAALEHFFEDLSAWLLHKTIERWKMKNLAGGPALGLVLRYATKIEWEKEDLHFDRVRVFLDGHVRREHSVVLRNNHGTAIGYLVSILGPLGVDIPKDPKLRNSLDALVRVRGERAHRNQLGAKLLKAPGDLRIIVGDCLELALKVRDLVLAAQ